MAIKDISKESYMMNKECSDGANRCPACGGELVILYPATVRWLYGNDIPNDYAEPCPVCKGGMDARAEQIKKYAGIPACFSDKHYEDFRWDIYKDDKGNILDLSRLDLGASGFINNFEAYQNKGKGLYIWSGIRGSGKTFLASIICNELIERYAIQTKFVSAFDLLDIAKSEDPGSWDEYKRNPIKYMSNCKLLVIDDIGIKPDNEWMNDILYKIINTRMTNKLVTIITSNIFFKNLGYDSRISDRINDLCEPFKLPDYCVRAVKVNKERKELAKELGFT